LWKIILIPLAGLLAGCVGSPNGSSPANASAASSDSFGAVPLNLTTCDVVELAKTLTVAEAQTFLPNGFDPSEEAASGSGGPTVLAIVGGASCAETGSGGLHRAYTVVSGFPGNATWRRGCDAGYEFYDVELDLAAGNALDLAARMAEAQTSRANVTLDRSPPISTLAVQGANFSESLSVTGGAAAPAAANNVCEWVRAQQGFMSIRYRQNGGTDGFGFGTLRADPGTAAARVFGHSASGPTFVGAATVYSNATALFFAGSPQ
jgi:hypothetical protein